MLGADDAAAGLAADRETHQPGAGGRARTGARSRRAFFEQPGIHGLAAEPDVVERQRAQAQLGHQHRAGIAQALHHRAVRRGHAIAVRLGAPGGGMPAVSSRSFTPHGNAVQRAAILAGGDLGVGGFRLLERQVAGERDDAAQLGVEALQAVEVDVGEALGGELARLDPARKLRERGEGDVGIARGQRAGVDFGAHETVAVGSTFQARQAPDPTAWPARPTLRSRAFFGPVRRS
jgi:hypothetical protein